MADLRRAGWRHAALVALGSVAVAALAHRAADRGWESVVRYGPPFHFADADAAPGPRVTHRVVLVVVDGLRLDRSRELKFLNQLRVQGADFDCLAGVPSYSRPGRATLATGAWPEVHGVTSNRHTGVIPIDNLFRSSRRVGDGVAVAGSDIWRSLFAPDLEGATVVESMVREERGAFPRVEPRMQNFERDAARRMAASEARLTVLDLVVPDYAAHEFGARSPQYVRACLEADRTLGLLVADLNLYTATLVVTADHGHIDGGGHGGVEPEVLQVPLVIVGRGIRPGFMGTARQVDVAPTIAGLLGLPIPAGTEGRPLIEAFDTKDENLRGVAARGLAEKNAFARQYISELGGPPAPAVERPPGDVSAALSAMASVDAGVTRAEDARSERERAGRLPWAVGALVILLLGSVWAIRFCGWAGAVAAGASAVAGEGLFRLFAHAHGLGFSISVINHDEDLERYFARVFVLEGAAALGCVASALLSARSFGRGGAALALLGLAAAIGAACEPALVVARVYWDQGLEMTWRVGNLADGFAASVALARLQAVGVVGALAPILAWLTRPAGTPRSPAP
ncbi:MAG: alkaline phosphatase family protein [Vicinamibacteria bacterium]